MNRTWGFKNFCLLSIGLGFFLYWLYKSVVVPVYLGDEIEFHVWNVYLKGDQAIVVGFGYLVISLALIVGGAVGDRKKSKRP